MEIGVDRILAKMQEIILELAFYEKIDLELDDDLRDLVSPDMLGHLIHKLETTFDCKIKRTSFTIEEVLADILNGLMS